MGEANGDCGALLINCGDPPDCETGGTVWPRTICGIRDFRAESKMKKVSD